MVESKSPTSVSTPHGYWHLLNCLYLYDSVVSLFPEYSFPLCLGSGSPEEEPDVGFRCM